MSTCQRLPLYRVRLALGFCVGNLQLKPLCGWHSGIAHFRYAICSKQRELNYPAQGVLLR